MFRISHQCSHTIVSRPGVYTYKAKAYPPFHRPRNRGLDKVCQTSITHIFDGSEVTHSHQPRRSLWTSSGLFVWALIIYISKNSILLTNSFTGDFMGEDFADEPMIANGGSRKSAQVVVRVSSFFFLLPFHWRLARRNLPKDLMNLPAQDSNSVGKE